jgi:hypothetical protein
MGTLALALVSVLPVAPASALNLRAWISPTGNDAGECDDTSPCQHFAAALAKIQAGGEILCLGPGNRGGWNITKSVTVNCEGVIATNGDTPTGLGSIVVNVAATDRVILRGVDINMNNSAAFAAALSFVGAGTLVLDHVKIGNNSAGATARSGVLFAPNGAGRLVISNSTINDTGNSFGGAGVLIKPAPGGSAQVSLDNINVSANLFGVAADGTDSTAGINMTISDSVLASNINDGLVATTSAGGAPIGVMLKNTKSINNGFGVRSIGSTVTVRVDGSTIVGNGTGLSFSSGGTLLTFGNNAVRANGTDGSFSGSLALQ